MRHQRPRRHRPRCKATGNIRFNDKLSAEMALAQIKNQGPGRGQPEMVRSYRCSLCGGHHLTPEEKLTAESGMKHTA